MFFENIKLTYQNLKSNKMRAILSLLGIIIGVSSVIMITTLGKSAASGIQGEIASSGLETITIYKGWGEKSVDKIFKPSLGEELITELDGIDAAMAISEDQYYISSPYKSGQFNVKAVSDEFASIVDYEVEAGNFITFEDNLRRKQVIVLGSELAEKLFPAGHAVGSTIRLVQDDARSFTVIGIMKKKSASFTGSFNSLAYIPYDTYSKKMKMIKSVSMFILKVSKGSNAVTITQNVKDYLFSKTQDKDSFYVESPQSMMDMFSKVTGILNTVLGGIAAISLLVGGIGIMNIMLVSVTERTREIGIRKALGAKPSVIRGQFLTEAITLTITGGIIGIITGTGLSKIVTFFLKWDFAIDIKAYLIAIAFSSFIGIFFGFYPAATASKLDPIKALSYE